MHYLIALAVLASLIGFAFGETAARAFVGVVLALFALAVLGIIGIAMVSAEELHPLTGMPCVVLGDERMPAGTYDEHGNCVIKVPYRLTRPDELLLMPGEFVPGRQDPRSEPDQAICALREGKHLVCREVK